MKGKTMSKPIKQIIEWDDQDTVAVHENPVIALQEFLKTQPPALTEEEAEELDRIIREERHRGMADFENPLTRKPR